MSDLGLAVVGTTKCILHQCGKNLHHYHLAKIIKFNKPVFSIFRGGGGGHEIDFSSPSVEGIKYISNQALRLQPFLINLLHHVLKPPDFIFCCKLHADL